VEEEMKSLSKAIFGVAILALCGTVIAQELPRLSPKASILQTIGLTEVTITYCSPAVRGRVIWDGLVPYDNVWRTGANEATTISFADPVSINGHELNAGKYALFTVPGKKEWTIVFNTEPNQWGAFDKDDSKDILEIKVTPKWHQESKERMSFHFENMTENSAEVVLHWGKIDVPFTVTVDTQAKAIANIRAALDNLEEDDWATLNRCASYCIQNDILLDEAAKWLEKSISIQETFWNLRQKAQLSAKMGKTTDAIEIGLKAIDVSKSSDQPPPQREVGLLEKMIAEWRADL
jgi:hypothetical protein